MNMPLTRVVADLHCHTVASTHAYSTVTELARAAAEQRLLAIACTDHGPGAPDAPICGILETWMSFRLRSKGCGCSTGWKRT